MKKIIVAVLLALGLLSTMSLVACGSTKTLVSNFSVGASPAVEVTVGNGNVSLVVAREGEIIVTTELQKPDSVEYETSQDGDLITVNAKTRSGSRADVTVTVPRKTRFKVSIGNGNMEVADVQASGQANIGDGNITLKNMAGSFDLTDGNGLISLEGIRGDVKAIIGNGNITLSDATGSFGFISGNGDITLSNVTGFFDLIGGNGDIRFQGELPPGGNNSFVIGNGSVTVELSGSTSVALDLEIEQEGKIIYDLPVTVSEQSDYRLVGTIGNGEASLSVRTGMGDITIK